MKSSALVVAVLLLASTALAAVPPDLADLELQVQRFPDTWGRGSESERLRKLFDLYWSIRMRQLPDLATYLGYPGLNDRWPDLSPEMIALYGQLPLDLLERGVKGWVAERLMVKK